MSEHQADPPNDIETEPTSPEMTSAAATSIVDSPKPTPEPGGGADAAQSNAPQSPGRVMIRSPNVPADLWQASARQENSRQQKFYDEAFNQPESEALRSSGMFGGRRMTALAAVIVLAAVTGAVTGALAIASLGRFIGANETMAANRALEETVMRMDADIAALKINVERAGKQNVSQLSKTADRLDKVEKAQVEPAAKLAKLTETVEKLRISPLVPAAAPVPVAAVAAPATEITGSIPAPAPKPEVARLPTVEGWALVDVANGGATIEGRQGLFEVYAGDPVPGLGRVDAIRKQDGRWVVVTSKGLIVAR